MHAHQRLSNVEEDTSDTFKSAHIQATYFVPFLSSRVPADGVRKTTSCARRHLPYFKLDVFGVGTVPHFDSLCQERSYEDEVRRSEGITSKLYHLLLWTPDIHRIAV